MAAVADPVEGGLVRAVGVAGPAGAAHAVYARDWKCSLCAAHNHPKRKRCFKCKRVKTAEDSDAAVALREAETAPEATHNWREAVDPTSNQLYYYNTETGATTWTRPDEMGVAPSGTGWFGRGALGSTEQERLLAADAEYVKRPARIQADFDPRTQGRVEGTQEYNIWYGKYLGDQWDMGLGKDPAPTRCVVERDAGYTKGDRHNGKERAYFCIHFARGSCCRGKDCTYYHRVPTATDDAMLDMMRDVFGRERHKGHKDDMSGVGSFESNSRTLYVGNLNKDCGEDLDSLLWKHFSEWGEVENINVIYRKSIAFVRYRLRANAEFAKVAMGNQDLGHKEVLNVRWAMDDPNPVARAAAQRADADAIAAMMQSHGATLAPAGYSYPAEYQGEHLPEADDPAVVAGQVAVYGADVAAGTGAGAGGAIGPTMPPAAAGAGRAAAAPGTAAPVAPGTAPQAAPGTGPGGYGGGTATTGVYESYFAKFMASGAQAGGAAAYTSGRGPARDMDRDRDAK